MKEEHDYFISKINGLYKNLYVNYIYIMPYVDLSSYKDEFAKANIVDSNMFSLKEDSIQLLKNIILRRMTLFNRIYLGIVLRENTM